jgi:hypothetical protein
LVILGGLNINHMPIPENIGIVMPDEYNDEKFLSRSEPKLKWSLLPRQCHASGRWLWLTPVYRADYVITGPGDPCVWTRWYSPTEMIILKLKGY